MTINGILEENKLGTLKDVNHAYGVTSLGIRVWLPKTYENEHWINVVLEAEGVIVQKSKKEETKASVEWESAVVIDRKKEGEPKKGDEHKKEDYYKKLDYKYTPVFCNAKECITIHAVKSMPIAKGILKTYGDYTWRMGLADDFNKASDKADAYLKEAKKLAGAMWV